MRKAVVNKAYRHEVDSVLKQADKLLDLEQISELGDKVRSIARIEWKKFPDAPLGDVVKEKIQNRVNHAGHGKTERKAARDFIKTLTIELDNVGSKWMARASEYPHLAACADEKLRAEEELRRIAEVAFRNESGAEIRVLIDGKFITPKLSQ